ncbi:ATP-binding protein [Terracoccus sp. 273MFTsu3.1]|uniref:AAA family ATPase n=1 Tax=Terracoccus sp. 273MFTsu3.1 TaxID=1172188 RepID=UPI000365EBAF|nr:ATP-binding protein [Terracoccus sp. 273MFTsu3.1]
MTSDEAERRTPPIITAEDMAARLDALESREAQAAHESATTETPDVGPPISPQRRHWREHVCLLDYFSLEDLHGDGPEAPSHPTRRAPTSSLWDSAVRAVRGMMHPDELPSGSSTPTHAKDDARHHELDVFVREDCDVVATRRGSAWQLRLDVRRATLETLGRARALALMASPYAVEPARDDIAHHMAHRLLEGTTALRGLTPTELAGILRALDWLSGMGIDLPSEHDVECELDLANVLTPLRAVSTDDFLGRERELTLLGTYLYGPPPTRPLALHGPGGVGKSTLLAHFVLEHVERTDDPLLFTYLTFDRGELDAQFPLTLVAEACRQLSLQAPMLVQPLTQVRASIDEVLTAQLRLAHEHSLARGRSSRDAARTRADQAVLAEQFAHVVNDATGGAPILVLLDTFEMAQRRRGSFLGQLGAALGRMQARMPSLRFVIAGRAPVAGMKAHNVPLEGLDPAQARALLRHALRGLTVPDDLVDRVASNVSGNPLSLRLAADLIRREGAASLSTSRGRNRLLFELREEQVQGVLYRRILDRVDRSVRPLANPGLVVRKITSDVILEVLAEPCGLARLTPKKAERLFDTLRREISLVTEARPGVLVHRADVRREMLPLLETEAPARVREIHERAVTYYAGRPEFDDQVEHLYHRLMLGEPSTTLDRYWVDSAAPFLSDAWTEYPPDGRVYLAGKLRVDADPEDLTAADRIAWVRQATYQAQAQLDAGQPALALEILRGRTLEPSDPTITRLVVEALAAQGDDAEALVVAEQGIVDAGHELSLDGVHLGILAARVAEDGAATDDPGSGFAIARRHYLDARDAAVDFGAPAEALTAAAGALRVTRRFDGLRRTLTREAVAALPPWPDPERDVELRSTLVKEITGLGTQEVTQHPGLLRELAAELGSQLPSLLIAAADTLGVDALGATARDLPSATRSVLAETATGTRSLPLPTGTPPVAEEPVAEDAPAQADSVEPTAEPAAASPTPAQPVTTDPPGTSSSYGSTIADALRTSPGDDELKESLSTYWQREADQPSYDYDEGSSEGSAP